MKEQDKLEKEQRYSTGGGKTQPLLVALRFTIVLNSDKINNEAAMEERRPLKFAEPLIIPVFLGTGRKWIWRKKKQQEHTQSSRKI